MDAPVPSCPEWDVRALLAHMGGHHRWVNANIHQAPEDGVVRFREVERAPAGDAVIGWVEAGVAALANELRAIGPNQPCWTWVDYDSTTGFWSRRTALETAVHRWDVQNSAGSPEPFEPAIAVDGIDEYLTITPFRFWGEQPEGTGQTIHVHATDAPGEWLLSLGADGMQVTREHAKGDVAVRGPASELWLALMGRAPLTGLEVFGDQALLERWREQARF
jgi:uncharacterized protein (TIGR03083 family)